MKKTNITYYALALLMLFLHAFLSGCNEEEIYHEAGESALLTIERADNQEPDRITVRFIPNEHTHYFCYALGTEHDRASFEDGTFAGIRKKQGNEPFEFTFSYLQPNTIYMVYARAYDINGKPTALSSMKLKTYTDAIRITPNFIGVYSAAFNVSVSSDYYKYSYAFGVPSDKEAFINGTLPGIEDMVEAPRHTLNAFRLQPSTPYTFFLMACDRGGNHSKVYEVPFETTSTTLGTAVTDFSASTPNMLYRNYAIGVNDQCSKGVVLISEEGELNFAFQHAHNGWNGDVMKMIMAWELFGAGDMVNAIFKTKWHTFTERTTKLFLAADPHDRPCEAFILLYDKEGEPFAVERHAFKSPSFDSSAAEAVAKIDKIVVEPESATFHISWDENTIGLALQTFEEEYYLTLTEEEIRSYLVQRVFETEGSETTYTEKTAENYPLVDYTGKTIHLIVAGVNKNGVGKGLGTYATSSFVAGKTD